MSSFFPGTEAYTGSRLKQPKTSTQPYQPQPGPPPGSDYASEADRLNAHYNSMGYGPGPKAIMFRPAPAVRPAVQNPAYTYPSRPFQAAPQQYQQYQQQQPERNPYIDRASNLVDRAQYVHVPPTNYVGNLQSQLDSFNGGLHGALGVGFAAPDSFSTLAGQAIANIGSSDPQSRAAALQAAAHAYAARQGAQAGTIGSLVGGQSSSDAINAAGARFAASQPLEQANTLIGIPRFTSRSELPPALSMLTPEQRLRAVSLQLSGGTNPRALEAAPFEGNPFIENLPPEAGISEIRRALTAAGIDLGQEGNQEMARRLIASRGISPPEAVEKPSFLSNFAFWRPLFGISDLSEEQEANNAFLNRLFTPQQLGP